MISQMSTCKKFGCNHTNIPGLELRKLWIEYGSPQGDLTEFCKWLGVDFDQDNLPIADILIEELNGKD